MIKFLNCFLLCFTIKIIKLLFFFSWNFLIRIVPLYIWIHLHRYTKIYLSQNAYQKLPDSKLQRVIMSPFESQDTLQGHWKISARKVFVNLCFLHHCTYYSVSSFSHCVISPTLSQRLDISRTSTDSFISGFKTLRTDPCTNICRKDRRLNN